MEARDFSRVRLHVATGYMQCLFTDNERVLLVNVGNTVTGVVEDGFVNYSVIELPSFHQETPLGITWFLLIPTYAGDILWDDCDHPTP